MESLQHPGSMEIFGQSSHFVAIVNVLIGTSLTMPSHNQQAPVEAIEGSKNLVRLVEVDVAAICCILEVMKGQCECSIQP